jgi:excisionase family DNA binding protein
MNKFSTNGISTTEAAARLGVKPETVRRWCEAGFGIRLGGRWRVSENRIPEIERNLSDSGTGMPLCRAPNAPRAAD